MQPIIKIQNLSKMYRLGEVGTGTLSHDLKRWYYRMRGWEDPYLKIGEANVRNTKSKSDYIWALKDINLEVMPGEVLGIIGKNGAGKSTLLKILSKVTGPTTGSIHYNGRIGALLEVGTGFHQELTGRENIFLNGAILGMTKAEIRGKIDEIIDFSGVERYIDTPVKRYSSGMMVRLGFAVAAHLEPEILVVDEVLAVGDAEFQKKAIGKMQDVSKKEGRTVLFVSHNMGAIQQLCTKCLILNNGYVQSESTDIAQIINSYLSDVRDNIDFIWQNDAEYNSIYMKPIRMFATKGDDIPHENPFQHNEDIYINLEFEVGMLDPALELTLRIYSEDGYVLFMTQNTDMHEEFWPKFRIGFNRVRIKIPKHLLNEGTYRIDLSSALHEILHIIKPDKTTVSIALIIKGKMSESPYWLTRRIGFFAPILTWK